MAGMLAKLQKRSRYEFTIDGEQFFARPMNLAEIARMMALKSQDLKTPFAIGMTMIDSNGDREWTQNTQAGETDEAFATRVHADLQSVEPHKISYFMTQLGKVTKVNEDTIAKNSEPTAKSDSPAA